MIKLIATDMDGTFLTKEGTYDLARLEALLDRFEKQGMLFAVASGRGYLSLEKLFAPVKDRILFIAENGSLVVFKDQVLYEASMRKDFYLETFRKLQESPYFDKSKLLLTGKKASYVLEDVDETYLYFSGKYNENIQMVESLDLIEDTIFKMTTNFDPEHIQEVEGWINQEVPGVKAMTTGFESIDIVLDYVDKGHALEAVLTSLELDKSQLLAFGDNLNDYHMMQVAGLAVAPENARVEIKALADEIIGHHQDAAVMTYMEGILHD